MSATSRTCKPLSAEVCFVCSGPRGQCDRMDPHEFWSEVDAYAWAARQPQGEPAWPVIDGEPLGGHL